MTIRVKAIQFQQNMDIFELSLLSKENIREKSEYNIIMYIKTSEILSKVHRLPKRVTYHAYVFVNNKF